MSIVSRQAAEAKGIPFDADADASMRAMVEFQIERQSTALAMSGRVYDDGVIDPRDTRTILGLCLWLVSRGEPATAAPAYGVFRM
jgi:acetyl-CoA carboxylase carboxyltransferase component